MKAYKGFTQNLTCRNFQYEVGKTYEEKEAILCEKGFHACEDPIDCFNYYGPANSVFHEVELDDVSEERGKDSKVVAKKITIGAEIDFKDIILGHIEYVNERIAEAVEKGENETLKVGNYQKATVGNFGVAKAGVGGVANTGNFGVANAGFRGVAKAGVGGVVNTGDCGVATTGNGGVATTGNGGVASASYCGVATAGNGGVATAGNGGVATAGNFGVANAGFRGVANAGFRGVANAGARGVATAGFRGVAVSRGSSETDANGISVARGNRVKAKGRIGTLLVVAEENSKDFGIKSYAVGIVDGTTIKEDIWYKCVAGNLVEVEV